MAYIPDVSGFLKPFGDDIDLEELLKNEAPQQSEFNYFENDITEFDNDMQVVIRAEDGFKIRLLIDDKSISVLPIRESMHILRGFYNNRGYLIKTPIFVFDGDAIVLDVCDKNKKINAKILQRKIKINDSTDPLFILRFWSSTTPDSISHSKVEFLPF